MKTIYTAIFSAYDDLKEPTISKKANGWSYVVFTDQDLTSDTWEIRKVPLINNDPVKTARYYKIMFHKVIETELSLWIDATFVINIDLNRWWKRFKEPFTTIDHPYDDCNYRDAASCLKLGRGEPDKIKQQIQTYHNEGLPEGFGLISSGILMRQNTPEVAEFCEQWWAQVEKFSSRDQIAFTYVYWNNPIVRHSIKWNYAKQKEFIHIPHLNKPWRNEKLKEVYASNQR